MHGMENVNKNLILSGVDPCTSKGTLQSRPFWSNLCSALHFPCSLFLQLSLSLSLSLLILDTWPPSVPENS